MAWKPEEHNSKERAVPRLPRWWWMPLVALAIILILWYILSRPAASSAPVMQDNGELVAVQARLSACEQSLANKTTEDNPISPAALNALQADIKKCQAAAITSKDTITKQRNNLTQLQATIDDAARRICCAQKVENAAINGYSITDGRIVCVTDSETPLSC